MKWPPKIVLILVSIVAIIAWAQSPTDNRGLAQETQVRGYWVDPSTGLMWAGRDNGKDVTWNKAMKYCRDFRLAGYSDWRLAIMAELQGIYDRTANAPGLGVHEIEPTTWHVKGNLFLTAYQWSSDDILDDRGHPSGYAHYFDFNEASRMKIRRATPRTNMRCAFEGPANDGGGPATTLLSKFLF